MTIEGERVYLPKAWTVFTFQGRRYGVRSDRSVFLWGGRP